MINHDVIFVLIKLCFRVSSFFSVNLDYLLI